MHGKIRIGGVFFTSPERSEEDVSISRRIPHLLRRKSPGPHL
jgi:hypothetical protein